MAVTASDGGEVSSVFPSVTLCCGESVFHPGKLVVSEPTGPDSTGLGSECAMAERLARTRVDWVGVNFMIGRKGSLEMNCEGLRGV